MTALSEFLAKIEELDKAATKGPFTVGAIWPQIVAIYAGSLYVAHAVRGYVDNEPARPSEAEAKANAEFLAFSRTALPAMARALKEILAAVDYAQDAVSASKGDATLRGAAYHRLLVARAGVECLLSEALK